VETVRELADGHGVTRAQVALAWILQQSPVTAPIIGASKMSHLDDAVNAVSLKLSEEEMKSLEAPYIPQPTAGFF
jgi:aryl-alcohol dehydrogenase-like predicted oxidoreductase